MKANELIHGGLYLIHDTSDIVVRYDIVSNSFRSEWYEYPLGLFHDDVCATDGDRYIFVKPIPLTEEILKANGFRESIEEDTWYFPECCKAHGRGYAIEKEIDGIWYITDHLLMPIIYVHELQHALRLCGLNDIADNFKVN